MDDHFYHDEHDLYVGVDCGNIANLVLSNEQFNA
jgi:hypothetical protein